MLFFSRASNTNPVVLLVRNYGISWYFCQIRIYSEYPNPKKNSSNPIRLNLNPDQTFLHKLKIEKSYFNWTFNESIIFFLQAQKDDTLEDNLKINVIDYIYMNTTFSKKCTELLDVLNFVTH